MKIKLYMCVNTIKICYVHIENKSEYFIQLTYTNKIYRYKTAIKWIYITRY